METKKRNGGFVMAEVVIALSVILIVMVSALSIAIYSVGAKSKTVNESKATAFAENVLECFKEATSEEEFLSLVKFAEGVVFDDGNRADNVGHYTHVMDKSKFDVVIDVSYNVDRPSFEITITEDTSDENNEENTIVSFSYTKGQKESEA